MLVVTVRFPRSIAAENPDLAARIADDPGPFDDLVRAPVNVAVNPNGWPKHADELAEVGCVGH